MRIKNIVSCDTYIYVSDACNKNEKRKHIQIGWFRSNVRKE